ncbi:MAG TPA: AMP-binding protein [Xanthobacteraceae bacterium]|nr:AMP-binding protein [Xanthobacteraceae bacterium]
MAEALRAPAALPVYPKYPTILHALATAAELKPAATALVCEDREVTYGGYAQAVAALAHEFAARGVAGERIAVAMSNSLDAGVGMLAAMAAGAQVAPMNPNYTEPELEPIIRDVAPRLLVCDAGSAQKVRSLAAKCGIAGVMQLGPGGLMVEDLLARPRRDLPLPKADDLSTLFFTGGTTGVPKGANHTHSTLMAYCYGIVARWPFPLDAARILNIAPLFHIWGFCFTLMMPVYIRAFMDLMPAYKPALVLEEFQKRRITVFAGGPAALYLGLRANENFAKTDFSSLQVCLSGGSSCPEELVRSWEAATGSVLLEAWGMSEGAPISATAMHGVRKIGSVGMPPPDTEVQVVDLETGERIMPAGERGELRVRGPQFIKEYRNRPEETKQAIRNGWLYTGDIGYFDADGHLFLVDRKKEMIIVGGYNVYPREIDELLFNHPAILEAATVGVPDAFTGEAVKAFVVLRPGARLTAEELLDYCRQSLVKYKVPTRIAFIDALPRSGVGKINKLALKQQA